MRKNKQSEGIGLILGIAFGIIFGQVLFDNNGIGIALGISLGFLYDEHIKKKKGDKDDEK